VFAARAWMKSLVLVLAPDSVSTSAPPSLVPNKLEVTPQRLTRTTTKRRIRLVTVSLRSRGRCRLTPNHARITIFLAFLTSSNDHRPRDQETGPQPPQTWSELAGQSQTRSTLPV
jgi:hypothetical protein